jgi:hypothetical protein
MQAEIKDLTTIVYNIEAFKYGMREFAICGNNSYITRFGQSKAETKNGWAGK